MKLKYYMRGLGIGIIVTALLMGYSNKTHATDEKAKMVSEASVENTDNSSMTLREQNDTLIQEDAGKQEPETEEKTDIQTASSEPETDEKQDTSENEEITEENTAEESEQESNTGQLKNGDKVIITVNTGEGSGTVARKLENAGVIDNASEFDAYLMQHGYDKSISRGDHEVIVGSSWMEIAKQMTMSK